jgi:site-specific DNA-methyltransferase (adenine-specific)
MPDVYRVLKQGSHAYIFTNALNLTEMLNESQKAGFKLHNLLVWEKNNCTPSQYYMKNCEYILFLRKGKAKYINNIGESKTVHQFKNIIGNKTHPTEKPVDLLKFYIRNSSNESDIIFDPFSGTGSTLVAAKEIGRQYLGYEIEKSYCEIAKTRLQNI